jgi:hypothetical protein
MQSYPRRRAAVSERALAGVGGGPFYFVAAASLDEVDPEALAAAPLRYLDGRYDRNEQVPADTRLM